MKDIEQVEAVNPCFTVGEDNVSIIKQTKYLNLMVDQYLNWKDQILSLRKSFPRRSNVKMLLKVSPSSHKYRAFKNVL